MAEIGSIIRAKVNRVEPYGVFLDCADGPVIVLVPEVSWTDRRPLPEQVQPGQEYDVLVLRYNARDRQIVGSIRRLHPEQNPYRQLAQLEPGTVLHGRVVLPHEDQLTVELPNGAWGHVPTASVAAGVKRGDELELVITALDTDEGRLRFEAVGRSARHANGSATPLSRNTKA